MSDVSLDPDGDGLTNYWEYKYGTDPHDNDTDDDGFSDGDEVRLGYEPNNGEDYPESTMEVVYISSGDRMILYVICVLSVLSLVFSLMMFLGVRAKR